MAPQYDIILFGVTGFTGKLAAEFILAKGYQIKWAVCARNEGKARASLEEIGAKLGKALPPIEVCDLVCSTPEQEETLREVVRKAKVVLTTAGPFDKYGHTLVKVCAESGVHYADITGESDFFRAMIGQYDEVARNSGAKIVMHCGNDCIPWDLMVFEMSKYAQGKGCKLVKASTYTEFPVSTAASGGTLTTAIYQLGKKRDGNKPDFDPLLRTREGAKSECSTKVTSPKADIFVKKFDCNGGPWIMGPVMANCVRRSNALLGYSTEFEYSELMLRGKPSWGEYIADKAFTALVAAAVVAPSMFQRFLPGPGEGPAREVMESGWLKLHATGKMVDGSGQETMLSGMYHFTGDCGYLHTASMLVESGMALLEGGQEGGGVTTPAVALGSRIVSRLETSIGAKLEFGPEK